MRKTKSHNFIGRTYTECASCLNFAAVSPTPRAQASQIVIAFCDVTKSTKSSDCTCFMKTKRRVLSIHSTAPTERLALLSPQFSSWQTPTKAAPSVIFLPQSSFENADKLDVCRMLTARSCIIDLSAISLQPYASATKQHKV